MWSIDPNPYSIFFESVNKSVLFLFDDSLSGFPAPPFFLKGSHQTQDESITRSP